MNVDKEGAAGEHVRGALVLSAPEAARRAIARADGADRPHRGDGRGPGEGAPGGGDCGGPDLGAQDRNERLLAEGLNRPDGVLARAGGVLFGHDLPLDVEFLTHPTQCSEGMRRHRVAVRQTPERADFRSLDD